MCKRNNTQNASHSSLKYRILLTVFGHAHCVRRMTATRHSEPPKTRLPKVHAHCYYTTGMSRAVDVNQKLVCNTQ
ncbi:hypothetical protein DPMN_085248 [Dreissena polymorpha]|uniref:Uncharacterized protein n=1 Tax=Dreissena polymorpha TaxID=45954 RepID=A0A9D3YC19_DREPO|nr:hypothetical protein DPMN_085248 [Dreissena polymorpha]